MSKADKNILLIGLLWVVFNWVFISGLAAFTIGAYYTGMLSGRLQERKLT